MKKDLHSELLSNNLQSFIIDVGYVVDLKRIWEILVSVVYVWGGMLGNDWLWDSERLVDNYRNLFVML